MTTSLFGRNTVLEFGTEASGGLQVSTLRVGFNVQLSNSRKPNKATIEVYNLAPTSVALLEVPLAAVMLKLGYGTVSIPRLVFQGTPIKGGITQTKQGPDRITTIQAADGGRVFSTGRVEFASVLPTTLGTIFNAATAQLAPLTVGTTTGVNVAYPFPRGFNFSGSAKDFLDLAADISLADWYILDNTLHVVPIGTPIPATVPIYSSEAGTLIGQPAGKDNGVQITALADASMRPGQTFNVVSPTINGAYIATDVQFIGDSGFANPYYVKVTGKLPG
jgi:hypothetical protein